MSANIPPPTTPIAMSAGKPLLLNGDWWRYFSNLNRSVDASVAGTVTTAPGSGLAGGGAVSDGISLSIAANGVTNAMFRQSAACSVVGRYPNSTGNVSDIPAVQNRVVLGRQSNQVAFFPSVDVPEVSTDLLIVASDAPATAASDGTAGTITWDSGFLYVCIAADTWKRVAIATW